MSDDTNDGDDGIGRAYVAGLNSAWTRILCEAASQLDFTTDVSRLAKLQEERARAVGALRDLCANHGDNDWPDTLDLEDIIINHLERHLDGGF